MLIRPTILFHENKRLSSLVRISSLQLVPRTFERRFLLI
uniref:Uncharacterized protein n=1 Tax=Lepeophtheirus salmonis TaxID=72036 RepID=A0A0K2SZR7_LEPSM